MRERRAGGEPAAAAAGGAPRRPSRTGAASRGAAAEAPAFDVVRVEPDGSAVVAGTAAPGSTVTVYADDAPLAEAEADAQGNFVAIFEVEPSAAPRALTLCGAGRAAARPARSEDVVMLLPQGARAAAGAPAAVRRRCRRRTPGAAAPEAAVAAAAAPTARPMPRPARSGAEVAAGAPAADPAAAAAAPEVAATAILRGDAVEVLPPPGDPAAAAADAGQHLLSRGRAR